MPITSVIIPAFNAGSTVGAAIESVLSQERALVEVIVVDDGSTDNTKRVVAKYSGVKYVYQENAGVAAARNLGVKLSTGDFIAFLDSDDVWLPCHLAGIMPRITTAGTVWGFTAVKMPERYYTTGNKQWPDLLVDDCYFDDFFSAWGGEAPLHINGMVIRRNALSNLGGFNSQMPLGEDLDLWFRIGLRYPKMAFQLKPCVLYNRNRPGSLTSMLGADPRVYLQLLGMISDAYSSASVNRKKAFRSSNRRLARFTWVAWYLDGDPAFLRMLSSSAIDLPLAQRVQINASANCPSAVRVAIGILKKTRSAIRRIV